MKNENLMFVLCVCVCACVRVCVCVSKGFVNTIKIGIQLLISVASPFLKKDCTALVIFNDSVTYPLSNKV